MANYKVFYRTEKAKDNNHKINQDRMMFTEICFMNDEKIKLIVVADGMGGLRHGERAAYYAVEGFVNYVYQEFLREYMKNVSEDYTMVHHMERVQEILRDAVQEANRAVCEHAEAFEETGTTLSGVIIVENYGVVVNIGDSPVYYYNSREEEFRLVGKLFTKAEREAEEGKYLRYSKEYYENDHIIYASLGEKQALSEEDISIKVIEKLHDGDMILVGSDGAFGKIQESEIQEMIQNEKEYSVLKNLFQTAREQRDDDQTAILYKVGGEV